jgi:hypothetical protein
MLDPNNINDVRKARQIVAELAANNPLITPVFERIDREYKAMLASGESEMQKLARRARETRQLV